MGCHTGKQADFSQMVATGHTGTQPDPSQVVATAQHVECVSGCGRKAAPGGYSSCCRTCTATGGAKHGPRCGQSGLETVRSAQNPDNLLALVNEEIAKILGQDVNLADAERYSKPDSVWTAIESETVVLLRASWLVCWDKAGQVMPRCQALPKEAAIGASELKSIWDAAPEFFQKCALPIIAISYCWLTATHPDPEGVQLELIAAKIEQQMTIKDGYANYFKSMGVFWDWPSLPQKDAAGRRSKEEQVIFNRALNATMDLWYGHRMITVYLCTKRFRDGVDYDKRGWPLFERSGAELIKPSQAYLYWYMCLDLGGNDTRGAGRQAPMPPQLFAEEVARRHFTNGGDRVVVTRMYTRMAVKMLRVLEVLDLSLVKLPSGSGMRLGQVLALCSCLKDLNLLGSHLGEEEATTLFRILPEKALPMVNSLHLSTCDLHDQSIVGIGKVISQGGLPQLQYFSVEKNQITDNGIKALVACCKQGGMRELSSLDLKFNDAFTGQAYGALADAIRSGKLLNLKKLDMLRLDECHPKEEKLQLEQACADHNITVKF